MERNPDRSKVRLTFDVSPEVNDRLEEIATATHTTKSDVLRKAFTLISLAVEAKDRGERLYLSSQPPAGASREIVGI